MKNCINCGASIEYNTTKCPYCNTSYFDFTNIDFDNKAPVVLRLKINGFVVETLCVPRMGTIENHIEETTATGYFGEPLINVKTATQISLNVGFDSVYSLNNPNGYLKIYKETIK